MLPGAQHHLLDTAWNKNRMGGGECFEKVRPATQRVLYLSPETDASPRTGLKDVPGAISARLETAPCEDTISHL